MINTAIAKLAAGQNLAGTETREVFDQIMSGCATNAQIAAFITAMRMKGETIDEITACAQVLRELPVPQPECVQRQHSLISAATHLI